MKSINKISIVIFLTLFFSCDAFEYHSYDGNIKGEKNINNKNIKLIEQNCEGKQTIRFAFMGDTQRHYDETEKFVSHLNSRDDIDFVIHGGDISDFGSTKEFMWMRDILNKLKQPYVVLLGNHDCLANGNDIFQDIFGKENFAFKAGNNRFVCLNTNALEFDYSRPVPDFTFLEEQLKLQEKDQEKTVVVMHARPYSEQFNNNVATVFQRYVKEFSSLQFCVNAHDHNTSIKDIFEDGIMYYGVPSIEKKAYFIFTIKPNEYEYELVEF